MVLVWTSPRADATANFRRKIDETLKVVERIIQDNKNPLQLAESVDHRYADKYSIVEQICNTGIAATLNVLEQLDDFDEAVLRQVVNVVQVEKRSMTLRLTSEEGCEFIEEKTRTVESPVSHRVGVMSTQTDAAGNVTSTDNVYSHKIVNEVKEFHWRAGIRHSLVLFAGTDASTGVVLGSRTGTTRLVTSMKKEPFPPHTRQPMDLSLTWLIKHVDKSTLKSNFEIDRDQAKTPRRNQQVEEAMEFIHEMQTWVESCGRYFCHTVRHELLSAHKESCPADWLNKISAEPVFIPVAPLLREEPQHGGEAGATAIAAVLSENEVTLFLKEQCRSLKSALLDITGNFPDPSIQDAIVSGYEATLVLLWSHLFQLAKQWHRAVDYVEHMLHDQLVSAIGKEVESKDFDAFLRYHNQRVFPSAFSPKPFCYAIRQPNEYPSGVLSIVTGPGSNNFGARGKKREADPIETFVRHIPSESMGSSMGIPLNAATTVEFVGDLYLHGWMETFFASEHYEPHFISARARQFSCFLLITGTIGPNEFTPKDAIILQNKDEVLIPLLTTALPSAKEFKDAIQSLSPEQQRFAKSFRAMQLGTSVFGICVVQVKPQLEALLGLPPQALSKEIKLTEDLLSLFVDYQIPSNLLTYDGDEAATPAEKVAVVKQHVKAVTDVIDGIKDAQLKEEIKRTDMRLEKANRPDVVALGSAANSAPFGSPPGALASDFTACASAPPKMMMMKAMARRGGGASRARSAAPPPPPPQADAGGAARQLSVECCDDNAESAADDGFDLLQDRFEGMELRKEDKDGEIWNTEETDISTMPKKMDQMFESFDKEGALRTIIIGTGDEWTRTRQENLLASVKKSFLHADEQKTETNKALDLLDALSRSGSLPVPSGELHVLIGVRHSFEQNVMGAIIQENMNPIEKVDYSSLLIASTIHSVDIPTLLTDSTEPPTLVLKDRKFPPLMLKDNKDETKDDS